MMSTMAADGISKFTGMTPAQAGGVIWTVKGVNLPIAEALAKHRISLGDLAWMAIFGYTPALRTPALTMLLQQLTEDYIPQIPTPLKVVTASHYSEYQQGRALFFLGALIGATGIFFAGVLGLFAYALLFGHPLLVWIVLPFEFLGIFLLWRLGNRFGNRFEAFLAGRRGEERVLEQLRIFLDGSWTVYHDLADVAHGDIDFILVGPPGVFALEVKAYTGAYRVRGKHWEYKSKRGYWHRADVQPAQQARRNAVALHKFLQARDAQVAFVEPAVISAPDPDLASTHPTSLELDGPETPVIKLDSFNEGFASLLAGSRHPLNSQDLAKVNAVLSREIEVRRLKLS